MALKPDRIELADGSRIKYFCNEVVERGCVMVLGNPGGDGMDNPNATVATPTGTGGVPAGVLMNDVEDIDLTRVYRNDHRDVTQVGNKVALLRRGVVRTNVIKSGQTPDAGDPAHFDDNGEFTTVTTSARVGTFVSPVDADGFVEVEINIV